MWRRKRGIEWTSLVPSGGTIPIDPESLIISEVAHTLGMGGGIAKRYEDRAFMNLLNHTMKVSEVDAATYDAIYMTGGHGVMFDFRQSTHLAALTATFCEMNKVISAVCHGPAGLLEVKLRNGHYLLAGKNVTGFSWKEEELAKREQAVPFSLEGELQRRGAKYSKALVPFNSHVVRDGHLITGQNPGSAKDVAKAVVNALQKTS